MFMNGDCRIMICTDAYDMGMSKQGVRRVFLWRVAEIEDLEMQYFGRGGRELFDTDFTSKYIIIAFMEKFVDRSEECWCFLPYVHIDIKKPRNERRGRGVDPVLS
jgi:hypothetical protein